MISKNAIILILSWKLMLPASFRFLFWIQLESVFQISPHKPMLQRVWQITLKWLQKLQGLRRPTLVAGRFSCRSWLYEYYFWLVFWHPSVCFRGFYYDLKSKFFFSWFTRNTKFLSPGLQGTQKFYLFVVKAHWSKSSRK